MFENMQDLIDAIEGEYGEELEQQALDFAEETGLLDQWEAEDAEAESAEYLDALGQELGRVEHAIGRSLTRAEEQGMLNGISTEEFGRVVPDMVTAYGDQLRSARDTDEGRLHLAAEAAQRAMDEQADPPPVYEPPPSPEPADEGGYDEGYDYAEYE